MAIASHTTPADGTFSSTGSAAWNADHTITLGADENFVSDAEKTALATHLIGRGVVSSNVAITNTVAETTLFTYTFPANDLGINERVILDLSGAVTNASAADDYTVKVYLDGALLQTLARVGGNVADAGFEFKYSGTVRSVGVTVTVVTHSTLTEGVLIYSLGVAAASTIDTTTPAELKVTITWANAKAGNIITLTQGHITTVH